MLTRHVNGRTESGSPSALVPIDEDQLESVVGTGDPCGYAGMVAGIFGGPVWGLATYAACDISRPEPAY